MLDEGVSASVLEGASHAGRGPLSWPCVRWQVEGTQAGSFVVSSSPQDHPPLKSARPSL